MLLKLSRGPSPSGKGGADAEGVSDFGPFEVRANLSATSAAVSLDWERRGRGGVGGAASLPILPPFSVKNMPALACVWII